MAQAQRARDLRAREERLSSAQKTDHSAPYNHDAPINSLDEEPLAVPADHQPYQEGRNHSAASDPVVRRSCDEVFDYVIPEKSEEEPEVEYEIPPFIYDTGSPASYDAFSENKDGEITPHISAHESGLKIKLCLTIPHSPPSSMMLRFSFE